MRSQFVFYKQLWKTHRKIPLKNNYWKIQLKIPRKFLATAVPFYLPCSCLNNGTPNPPKIREYSRNIFREQGTFGRSLIVCLGKRFPRKMDKKSIESIISNGGTGSRGIIVVVIFSESFPGEHFMTFGWKYSQKPLEIKIRVVRMVKMMARISKIKVPTNIFFIVFGIVSEQRLIMEKEMDVDTYLIILSQFICSYYSRFSNSNMIFDPENLLRYLKLCCVDLK